MALGLQHCLVHLLQPCCLKSLFTLFLLGSFSILNHDIPTIQEWITEGGGGPPVNTLGAIRLYIYIYIHVCVWRFNTSSSPTLVYSTFNRCRFISSPINIHRLRGRWDSKRWGDFGRGDSTRGVPSRTAEGLRAEICLGPGYLFQFLSAQKVWNSAEAIETACSIRTGVGGKRRRAWRSAQTSAVQWTSMNLWTLASQWIGDGRWIYR